MKKILFIILTLTITFTYSINCFATYDPEPITAFKENNITIVFEDNTSFTEAQQQYISDMLLYGESDITLVQPRSWCWLTGHDSKTEYVTIITHKKYDTVPRCLEEVYEVTTCSKCDLYDMVLISGMRIACCEED